MLNPARRRLTLASPPSQYALWIGRRICIRLRSILIAEVFTKALRRTDSARIAKALASAAPGLDPLDAAHDKIAAEATKDAGDDSSEKKGDGDDATEGKILNLVSVDAFSVSEIAAYMLYLVPEAPVTIGLAIYFLYSVRPLCLLP